jgi:hypothetical protein
MIDILKIGDMVYVNHRGLEIIGYVEDKVTSSRNTLWYRIAWLNGAGVGTYSVAAEQYISEWRADYKRLQETILND